MIHALIEDLVFLLLLVVLSIPLGLYIYKVMSGERVFLSRLLRPVEQSVYRLMGVREDEDMAPAKYAISVMLFGLLSLLIVFALQVLQARLPFNPGHLPNVRWDLALNTAASYVTNTNWQAYSGESTMSFLTQSLGLTVQNFVSAGTGIAILFVLIRGFIQKRKSGIGNYWQDLTRSVLYVLLPLSLLLAVVLVSQGVVQSLEYSRTVVSLETGAAEKILLGPAAGQIAIKQIGSNGGGFFGANSAYPLENPTALSNLLQLLSILLIPAALCISFGKAVRDSRQGAVIYAVMLILLAACVAAVTVSEFTAGPQYPGIIQAGSLEGKETIHGIGTSALWATATTASSNGSVNAMLDSFTPLSGAILLFLMQSGEVVFGGVGSGLYGMLAFILLTVFITGLMVGRTPEFLGKKIEPFDMKMVSLIILIPPLLTLAGTMAAVLMPAAAAWLTNSGAHGFSEILYAFSSMANNNGSAFAGFAANTAFTNLSGSVIMLASRFIPMIAVIYLAGSLSGKKTYATSEGTLSTRTPMFIGLLIVIILLIGALTFLPALALGPFADFFSQAR